MTLLYPEKHDGFTLKGNIFIDDCIFNLLLKTLFFLSPYNIPMQIEKFQPKAKWTIPEMKFPECS